METISSRRTFLKRCSHLGVGCLLLCSHPLPAFQEQTEKKDDPPPDPKKLEYCGYNCPDDCEMRKASTGSVEEKKAAFDKWKWEEKFGVEFDPDIVFCHTCKEENKPINITIQKCTVRACAVERKLESCIECQKLGECQKDLWTNFPQFKEHVINLQKKYIEATGKKLIKMG